MFGIRDVGISPVEPSAFCALADVRALLGVTDTSQDTLLTGLINTVSAAIEDFCNNVFTQRTVTEVIVLQEPTTNLVLKYPPQSNAITSISYDYGAGPVNDLLTNYRVLGNTGILRRFDNTTISASQWGSFAPSVMQPAVWTVVYTAGFATLPPAIVQAALEYVRELYVYRTEGQSAGIASESEPDVGSVSYAHGGPYSATLEGPTGSVLPVTVAALVMSYVVNFDV